MEAARNFQISIIFFIVLLKSFEAYDYSDAVDGGEPVDAPENVASPSKDENVLKVGDMMLSDAQYDYLYSEDSMKRHGLEDAFFHWPQGIVPILIDEAFAEDYKQVIISAMEYIMNISCIQFDWTTKPTGNYVFVTPGDGCSSFVGLMAKGEQNLTLSQKCKKGNIIHELLHALGFLHMHTAVQRDDFIKINFDNIPPEVHSNFKKYTTRVSMFNTQYDYRSIMHYSRLAFAINKNIPTVIPFERVSTMGQREEMTDGDITRLNRMYSCPNWVEEELGLGPTNTLMGKEVEQERKQVEDLDKSESAAGKSEEAPSDDIEKLEDESEIASRKSFPKPSKLLSIAKYTLSSMLHAISPVCKFQDKLHYLMSIVEMVEAAGGGAAANTTETPVKGTPSSEEVP